jgi:hypothetical protein
MEENIMGTSIISIVIGAIMIGFCILEFYGLSKLDLRKCNSGAVKSAYGILISIGVIGSVLVQSGIYGLLY